MSISPGASRAPLGTPGRLRLLAVHAHPDDEASKGAATTAMYADTGAEVLVVTCTGGERGDVLYEGYRPPAGMAFDSLESKRAVRELEMAAAAAALGVQHLYLGWTDSGYAEPRPGLDLEQAYPQEGEVEGGVAGLADVWDRPLPADAFALVPLQVAAAPLVEAVRRFRPHVITTYDHFGGYPHPDHVYTHAVTWEAWRAAGDPSRYVIPGGAPAWEPLKLYYNHGFSTARLRAIHTAMQARGLESPFGDWLASREAGDAPERPVTALIRSVDYFPARDAALRAHRSQVDPDGFFFAVPRDLEAEVWPWDEYELGASRVPVGQEIESDLFAGITPA
ncbi:MAG: PIG-L family deacetylase [Promicromonosporaceae bacterium]|nr:PIG-L family deacetylase [Promicromonosporaceae bacterium]